ncbi:MAG TPA: hypothetical protein VFR02_00420 [bacterium]|nr:hypothetical protein [bacterium]
MSRTEIFLSPEAEAEFEAIQRDERPLVRDWARRYLADLVDFPPEAWVDLHQRLKGVYFKSDNHVPFDIQGRVEMGPTQGVERVWVTRFRVRGGP